MANVAGRLDAALKAAGVPIVGVSIGRVEDRSTWAVHLADGATDEQAAAAAAIVAVFDETAPEPELVVSRLKFAQLFTRAERIAIRTAAAGAPALADFYELLQLASDVNLTHQETIDGLKAMTAAGLLGPGRMAQILAGIPPVP